MFKKILKLFCLLLVGVLTFTSLTACEETTNDNKLRIIVRNAGFGDTWIYELEAIFEAQHPEIDVDITSEYDVNTLIKKNLESSKNLDDIYISIGNEWKSYAAEGYFAELDEYLNDVVDGVALKDKVSYEYADSIYFTNSDGSKSCYRLPWTSGIGGIYYNKKMFEENGWEVPNTYEELVALCEVICDPDNPIPVKGSKKDAVKPFAYSGANTDYFDYTVYNWWAQIVGTDAIDEFLKYESASNYDAASNNTYAALKTATRYWQGLFADSNGNGESKYVISGSKSKTAEQAQKEFVNGYAAMMFNGDWLYNELIDYNASKDNFELGLMKTPVISEANQNYINSTYVIGEDQFIVVPATSKKIDLAVEFIKLMVSNQGSVIFTQKSNGFLAYDTDFSSADIPNTYISDMIALRSSYTSKFTSYSPSRKYLCNYIDIWCTSALRPYLGLLNGTTSLDTAFNTISLTSKNNWNTWTNRSK